MPRFRAIAAVVIVHLLVLAYALVHRAAVPRDEPAAMRVVALSAPRPRDDAAPLPDMPLLDAAIAPPVVEVAADGPAPGCRVADAVAAAIAGDAAAVAALAPLADDDRHAVMAWDGAWRAGDAVAAIRRDAVSAILATSATCRVEPLVGPRLVFLPMGSANVTIAFGSGGWTWNDLLSEDKGRSLQTTTLPAPK